MNDDKFNANGSWRRHLTTLGIPAHFLTGKNGPCPLCGGKDRYRFTDLNGTGSSICNQCGTPPSGGISPITLLIKYNGWTYPQTCREVGLLTGTHKPSQFERTEKPSPNERPARPLPIERPGELVELKRNPRQAVTRLNLRGLDVNNTTGATGICKCGPFGSKCQVSEWLAAVLPDPFITSITMAVAAIVCLHWEGPLNIHDVAIRFRMSRRTIQKEIRTLVARGHITTTMSTMSGKQVVCIHPVVIPF